MKHGGWIGTELGAGDNRTSQQAHVRTPGDVPKSPRIGVPIVQCHEV